MTTPPRTTAARAALGVRAPHAGVKAISSLGSVQVVAASGRSVGRSPPRPPHAGTRPGRRLTPSSSRVRPARLHLALEAERRQRARGAQQQRGPAPDRLADEDAAGRERSRRISVGREVAAVHRRHRAHPARQRARPGPLPHRIAGRGNEHPRVRIDPEHVHPPGPALASDPRPANPRRHLGARAPLVERARPQRQFGRGARRSRREHHREREKHGGAEDHAPVRVAADSAEVHRERTALSALSPSEPSRSPPAARGRCMPPRGERRSCPACRSRRPRARWADARRRPEAESRPGSRCSCRSPCG